MGDSYDDLEAAQCRDCIKLREKVADFHNRWQTAMAVNQQQAETIVKVTKRLVAVFNEGLQSIRQLAAAQATIERLREALEAVETTCSYNGPEDEIGEHSCCHELSYLPHSPDCWTHLRTKALALPNDTTALDARLKKERERVARQFDKPENAGSFYGPSIAAAIRSMT